MLNTKKCRSGMRILLLTACFCLTGSHAAAQPDSLVEIHNLRHHTHPSFTRIVVDIGRLREYTFNRLSGPDRLYVDILQARLNPLLHGKSIPIQNQYLQRIRIAQKNPSTVRIAADLETGRIDHYNIFHLPDPFRVVIDIYPKITPPKGNGASIPQPAEPTASGYSIARQLGLGVRRVVIDPGHGGKDPGCIGKKGTLEKTIVLDVSLRLRKLLSTVEGLNVILTRETDIFIPVVNRTVIANQKQADLFISIHANSNPRKKHSGIQSFFLNFSNDPSINAIAARENATSTKSISEMKDIIQRIARNSKIIESMELAQKIQFTLAGSLKKKYANVEDLGAKGGPFWVLIGGEMPSVLVEISHLSNQEEENRLLTPAYRQHIAEGIFKGIIEYMHSLGKG